MSKPKLSEMTQSIRTAIELLMVANMPGAMVAVAMHDILCPGCDKKETCRGKVAADTDYDNLKREWEKTEEPMQDSTLSGIDLSGLPCGTGRN